MENLKILEACLYQIMDAYLEHNLSEVLLVKLPEFSETKFTKVREEDSSFLLHLALHIDHLLLGGGQPQGLHGGQQVLNMSTSSQFKLQVRGLF